MFEFIVINIRDDPYHINIIINITYCYSYLLIEIVRMYFIYE